MKTTFQAKEIQRVLNIKKIRYEYLATRIGITADIEEVEGTGRAHIYSFENLVQFAVAHNANRFGLSPKATRNLVSKLNEFKSNYAPDILTPEGDSDYQIYYIYLGILPVLFFVGNIAEFYIGESDSLIESKADLTFINEKEDKEYWTNVFDSVKDGFVALYSGLKFNELLDMSDGYITINLSTIKKKIVNNL